MRVYKRKLWTEFLNATPWKWKSKLKSAKRRGESERGGVAVEERSDARAEHGEATATAVRGAAWPPRVLNDSSDPRRADQKLHGFQRVSR